jgi:hypothetical protein
MDFPDRVDDAKGERTQSVLGCGLSLFFCSVTRSGSGCLSNSDKESRMLKLQDQLVDNVAMMS